MKIAHSTCNQYYKMTVFKSYSFYVLLQNNNHNYTYFSRTLPFHNTRGPTPTVVATLFRLSTWKKTSRKIPIPKTGESRFFLLIPIHFFFLFPVLSDNKPTLNKWVKRLTCCWTNLVLNYSVAFVQVSNQLVLWFMQIHSTDSFL